MADLMPEYQLIEKGNGLTIPTDRGNLPDETQPSYLIEGNTPDPVKDMDETLQPTPYLVVRLGGLPAPIRDPTRAPSHHLQSARAGDSKAVG